MPDLLILDLAIYAGKGPDQKYLASIEKLLRSAHAPRDERVHLSAHSISSMLRDPYTRGSAALVDLYTGRTLPCSC